MLVWKMPGAPEKAFRMNQNYPYPEPALVLRVRSLRYERTIFVKEFGKLAL